MPFDALQLSEFVNKLIIDIKGLARPRPPFSFSASIIGRKKRVNPGPFPLAILFISIFPTPMSVTGAGLSRPRPRESWDLTYVMS